jgi:hypothetical protein
MIIICEKKKGLKTKTFFDKSKTTKMIEIQTNIYFTFKEQHYKMFEVNDFQRTNKR